MRLLEVKDTGDFSLIQVSTHNTYRYATLSHTWTDGEEVTYQDLTSGDWKSKAGYEKIKFCGEQATRDGIRYFWVDTCCIDKSNAVELGTAINSMFRWYRNAKKCYVYLVDVSTPDYGDVAADVQAWQTTREADFRKSKWFTRGWTLQELIAPAAVEFFSKEGQRLGDKKSLDRLIHEITGIPIQALQGDPFSDFSIAERIGWAAQRQTTEQEDIVYCLLGLCGVSMPPIYGEEEAVALKRLHMTVREFSKNGGALQKREAPPKPLRVLPFGRNRDFVGRQSQLDQLIMILHTQDTEEDCPRAALIGLGGVGKTQIALECAFQLQKLSPTCSLFWVRATDATSFGNAYHDIGKQLKIPGLDATADVKLLVKTWLSQESSGKWLMIVDNADDLQIFYHTDVKDDESSMLSEYLPFSTLGAILFTTRDRKAATRFAGSNVVVVDEMNDAESRKLLQQGLQDKRLIDKDSALTKLLGLLTNLPLAIMQAGAYMNANDCTVSEYIRNYEESSDNVVKLLSKDFEDSRRYLGTNPVATTWLISFKQIQLRDPLAADYLAFISCIKEQDIPRDLLPLASELDKTEAIGTLKAFGFIKNRINSTSFDMHRLVHIAMQNWLRLKKQWRIWNQKTLERIEHMFPRPKHGNRAIWLRYLPHALYLIASIEQNFSGTIKLPAGLPHKLAQSLRKQGKYAEAEALYRQALEICQVVLDKEHPDTLGSLNNLAVLLYEQGKYAEAEVLHQQTLEICQAVLGKEHPDTLSSMNNLAMSLYIQGKYKEADALNRRTLELRQVVLGKDHLDTLQSILGLATLLRRQGKYVEAEALFRQTFEVRQALLGKEHPDTLMSIGSLAISLCDQGKYAEAEALNRQTLELQQAVLGKEDPDVLWSRNNLAISLNKQGKCVEAEALFRQTLELQQAVVGKEQAPRYA